MIGCSSIRDNLSDASAATVAAGVATVNPVAGIAAGVATGVLVNTVTQPEEVELSQVQNEYQAEVAEKQILYDALLGVIEWIVGGVVLLILAAWLIPGPQTLFKRGGKDAG